MFDCNLDFKQINFREDPELYQVGKGEQGVLLVEPYKSEILPHWRFKTPDVAKQSSQKIYQMFLDYLRQDDFVGADMARKFLQMGYTRSRRYANHRSGRKYQRNPQTETSQAARIEARKNILLNVPDPVKAESAAIFKEQWIRAKTNDEYLKLLREHQLMYK
jgi:hypothetical protein